MKIAITIDEVLRDTLMQIIEVYEKYEIGEPNFESYDDIVDKDYEKYFPINESYKDVKNLNDLLYNKSSYEIFGAANFMDKDIMEGINEFIYDFYCEPENTLTILSKEFNRSIPSTLYFLAKTNITVQDYKFVDSYKKIWEDYDLIITAEPEIISSVPENKTVIKINAPYNLDLDVEHSFDLINDVFTNLDIENLK